MRISNDSFKKSKISNQNFKNDKSPKDNIKDDILFALISIYYYEKELSLYNYNKEKIFDESKIYYLINPSWIMNLKNLYNYQILSQNLKHIKLKDINITYDNFDYYIPLINNYLSKINFNLEYDEIPEQNMINISANQINSDNLVYYRYCYIIDMKIKNIIQKYVLKSNKLDICGQKVFAKNSIIYLNIDNNIMSGNLDQNFIFVSDYVLCFNSPESLLNEKEFLLNYSFNDYLKSKNIQKFNSNILPLIDENNEKIGEIMQLIYNQASNVNKAKNLVSSQKRTIESKSINKIRKNLINKSNGVFNNSKSKITNKTVISKNSYINIPKGNKIKITQHNSAIPRINNINKNQSNREKDEIPSNNLLQNQEIEEKKDKKLNLVNLDNNSANEDLNEINKRINDYNKLRKNYFIINNPTQKKTVDNQLKNDTKIKEDFDLKQNEEKELQKNLLYNKIKNFQNNYVNKIGNSENELENAIKENDSLKEKLELLNRKEKLNQNEIINKENKENKLDEREEELNDREKNLNDIENIVSKKEKKINIYKKSKTNNKLFEKDSKLNERENLISYKEKELDKFDYEYTEKEDNMNRRVISSSNLEKEKENELNKREEVLNNREKNLNEREKKIEKKEEEIINKENELKEKEIELNAREKIIKIKEDKVVNKENELKEKNDELIENQNNLNERLKLISLRENNNRKDLFNKENELQKREKALNNLNEREKIILQKENEIESKEIEFKNREIKLSKIQIELNEKLELILKKENNLNEREKTISNKEKEINNKLKENKDLSQNNKSINGSIQLPIPPPEPDPISSYKKPTLIGLNNIGATCFMNSTLQCLSQTPDLTSYFLKNSKKRRIINNNLAKENKNSLQLSPIYLKLIQKLWDKKGTKSFSPNEFMNTIEKMNPLFKKGQAGDSKDFIIYILEQIHKELKAKIKTNYGVNEPLNQYDRNNALNYFLNDFSSDCSIISDTFFGFTETTNECINCKNYFNSQYVKNPICYNFGIFNCLIFPLEEVKNYKNNNLMQAYYNMNNNMNNMNFMNNINQNNSVTLDDCFLYNQKTDLFTGENKNYCNICKQLYDSYYTSKIYSCPNNLILILNRGKNNIYNIKLYFNETIDITQYVVCNNGIKWVYNLYGVITHIGESGPNAHFVASCKSPVDKKWYRFNDAFVNPINDVQNEINAKQFYDI